MMISRKLATALLVSALAACSKAPPTEAARHAEKERMEALAKASQEEEREKDRRSREEATRIADEMTAPVSRPDTDPERGVPAAAAPAVPEWSGPGPAPVTAATPTAEDKAIALATGRIRANLAAPESMRIRSPRTREDNAFVCVEIDSKDRSGAYGGFVPVIVTREKILFYKDGSKAANNNELGDYLEFVKLNDRLRCW